MRRLLVLLATAALAACAGTEDLPLDNADDDASGGRGSARGDSSARPDAPGTDASGDAGAPDGAGGDDGATPGDDAGGPGDGGAGPVDGGCVATTLDEGIACQVAANDAFVDAFCDCFTEGPYEGDRAACVADNPTADDFEPPACHRAALTSYEVAAIAQSLCYAEAVYELADCVSVCPPDQAAFDACTAAVGQAFDACDAELPPALQARLQACDGDTTPIDPPDPGDGGGGDGGGGGGGTTEPPSEVDAALATLRAQRDAHVDTYCGCFGAAEYGSIGACVSYLQSTWDPGLSACERDVFSSDPGVGIPFVGCVTESFLIGETACQECPAFGTIEYDLCSDPSFDVNFCFNEAPASLQDALIACFP